MVFKKPRYVGAGSTFESLQDLGFIFTPALFLVSPERLVDIALEVDTNERTDAILEVLHLIGVKPGLIAIGR